ncbi:uncharacterized protein LOC116123885 [Pistacia vera]|uniref:uncharacterized protein LOC116123885 n=1 Tax=Pistacia vera TaxID=55513 RepID=UPI0012636809|nr:uncharacterized protein LOC116123885 [Pistacia vera]
MAIPTPSPVTVPLRRSSRVTRPPVWTADYIYSTMEASHHDWPLHQMDVHNVFLHGDLDKEIYMDIPPGLRNQGENLWNAKFTEALTTIGFTQSKLDYALFSKQKGESFINLIVYVDDILITGNDEKVIIELKEYFHNTFHIKDSGAPKFFLGIEIACSSEGISLSQWKYVFELIADSRLATCKPSIIPVEQNVKLTTQEYDEKSQNPEIDLLLKDSSSYQWLVRRLIYLTMTRPYISYAVQILNQFMHAPKQSHMDATMKVLKYLKGCPWLRLLLPRKGDLNIIAYYDSDWGSCPMTRRSLIGFCVKLGGSLISWKTKKQSTIPLSLAKEEYRAMPKTTCEVTWILGLLKDLNLQVETPIKLYCDNKTAKDIAINLVFHERTKHIEIDCHFVRDKIQV